MGKCYVFCLSLSAYASAYETRMTKKEIYALFQTCIEQYNWSQNQKLCRKKNKTQWQTMRPHAMKVNERYELTKLSV